MKLSPIFVFFVFFLLFGFPLIMVFGDHIFYGKNFMNYIFYGGIILCALIMFVLIKKAFKTQSTKNVYTKPYFGIVPLSLNYFSNPRISIKRKLLVILLPIILMGGAAILVVLATIYKIL